MDVCSTLHYVFRRTTFDQQLHHANKYHVFTRYPLILFLFLLPSVVVSHIRDASVPAWRFVKFTLFSSSPSRLVKISLHRPVSGWQPFLESLHSHGNEHPGPQRSPGHDDSLHLRLMQIVIYVCMCITRGKCVSPITTGFDQQVGSCVYAILRINATRGNQCNLLN